MCGIAGFVNFSENFVKRREYNREVAKNMGRVLIPRGPDAEGVFIGEHAVFAHRRLSVIDPEGGAQPMSRTIGGYEFVITYNGELYNTKELRDELVQFGYNFTTHSDTEVLLYSYIHYGTECAKHLNGIYAFCIWDSMRQRVYLCRDHFGVKPLFYTFAGNTLVFASEIKSLFEYPGINPKVSKEGLQEIFAISPARTQGVGVFKNIKELRPARYMVYSQHHNVIKKYWELESYPHEDSYEKTVERVHDLVYDSIKRQLVSDVPIGTLLSGGLDSSIITAIGALEFKKKGERLSTYSFDYKDNDKYFKASSFQPDADAPWVLRMSEEFDTKHTVLECDSEDLLNNLEYCVDAKDLPGMADVDASLLCYCKKIKENHTVILSGECSDEIFGGYPWFRSEKAFSTHAFPWCYDLSLRKSVLKDEVEKTLKLDDYSFNRYSESLREVPALFSDNHEEKRRREIAWLNLNWFMTNLLDRKDRMSMASGLEVRVPYCDYRLIQYVWNIPWKMKNKDNVSKSILREAVKTILPEDVLYRKKSPYPKTHNPQYEKMVKERLLDTISNPNAPLLALCDYDKIQNAVNRDFDYGKPFFGQLMAGPQFMGYLLQVNYWLEKFRVHIV